VEELEETLKNHRFHVDKLELLTRLLDNNRIPPDSIDEIKDFVELYLECFQDDDFYVDLDFYEVLELDKIGVRNSRVEDVEEKVAPRKKTSAWRWWLGCVDGCARPGPRADVSSWFGHDACAAKTPKKSKSKVGGGVNSLISGITGRGRSKKSSATTAAPAPAPVPSAPTPVKATSLST